jgi:hypothetical protein
MPRFQRSATLSCGFSTSDHSDVITLASRTTSARIVSTVLGINPGTTFTVALSVRVGPQWIPVAEVTEQSSIGTDVAVAHLHQFDCGDSPQVRVDWAVIGGTVTDAVITVVA